MSLLRPYVRAHMPIFICNQFFLEAEETNGSWIFQKNSCLPRNEQKPSKMVLR